MESWLGEAQWALCKVRRGYALTLKGDDNDLYKSIVQRHILSKLFIVSCILFLWELYVRLRQHRMVQKLAELPTVLDGLMEADVYKRLRGFFLGSSSYSIAELVYRQILSTILLQCGGFYFTWIWGKSLVEYIRLDPKNEIYVTAGCITVCLIILNLPIDIYLTFIMERSDNLRKPTPLSFVKNQIMYLLKQSAFWIPFFCVLVLLCRGLYSVNYFLIWFYLTISVHLSFLFPIYSGLIWPLFNKHKPLPEGDLKNRIEALASSLNFPLNRFFTCESASGFNNEAYLRGFYKYVMIVLSDNVVAEYLNKKIEKKIESQDFREDIGKDEKKVDTKEKKIPDYEIDEVVAFFAHELGHWHHSHMIQHVLLFQVAISCAFILFIQLKQYAPIYEAFEFTDSRPVLIDLMVAWQYVFAPLIQLRTWAENTVISWRFEFQADKFAASLGYGEALQRALIKMEKDNWGYPLFDKLYSNWCNSHPPLLERLNALKKNV